MSSGRRAALWPLVPLYRAAIAAKQRLADGGWLRTEALPGVVLSVGSLSAGGAGKTPLVQALAAALVQREFAVRILSRGYGRRSGEVMVVDPAGAATDFGDEPLLLARRTGVPVVVGASRYAAGLVAERLETAGSPLVHLLDDGFQHRRLARDLDIVLVTASDAIDRLLPVGNLREPLTALQRADVIVIRESEAEAILPLVRTVRPEACPVVPIRRSLVLPKGMATVRPLLFSGLARPGELRRMVDAAGVRVAEEIVFRDHHHYTGRDAERLAERARRAGADGFLTTEKDAVKLTTEMRARLGEVGALVVAELRVSFAEENEAIREIIALVPRLNRRHRR